MNYENQIEMVASAQRYRCQRAIWVTTMPPLVPSRETNDATPPDANPLRHKCYDVNTHHDEPRHDEDPPHYF